MPSTTRGCAEETTKSVSRLLREVRQQPLHRLGVLIEFDDVFHHAPARLIDGDRLEIGQEVARAGDIRFGLHVHPAIDRVVGPLEQQALAVRYQLDAGIVVLTDRDRSARSRGSTTDAVISSSICTFSAG